MTRVLKDSHASTSARMVLLVIANHETEGVGAFPSIDTLARECALTPRQIQRHIRTLEDLRELFTIPQGGPHGTNLYRSMPLVSGMADTSPRHLGPEMPPELDEVKLGSSGSNGSIVPKTSSVSSLSATKSRYSAAFEEFWKVYPRHKDKGHAADAFRAALKRAAFEEIIAGAQRYRDDPERDPAKTKYAQGWLSGDGWLDEPDANVPSEKARMLAGLEA